MTAIYKIRNVVNGKFYVGSTVDARVRFQTHRRQLRKGQHHCEPLQRAWNKYGEDCFKFEVIIRLASADDLFAVENIWLEEHQGQPYCYNVSRYADSPTRGTNLSETHRARISASNKGNQSARGYKRTPEECEIIRQRAYGRKNFLGRKHTEESKAKMSEAQKGNKGRTGHTNSPEHRARQSASMRGIKKSPEHIEKIRQRMIGTSYAKGRVMSEEQKAAMGRAVKELTTGLEFITIADAARHFGIQRANLIRTMRNGGLLKRGPNAGLHFQYTENVL